MKHIDNVQMVSPTTQLKLTLTKEELKMVIQSIECLIDPKKPRWAKDEAEDVDIILLLNKFKDRFYGI